MTRTQKIRMMALGLLAKRPADIGYPQHTLVAEVRMYTGEDPMPERMEVRAALDELVEEGCVALSVNPILGVTYYTLTEKGRRFAPEI